MIYLKRLLFITLKVAYLFLTVSLMCLTFPFLIVILSVWFYVKEGSTDEAEEVFDSLWDAVFGVIDRIEPKK